MLNRKTPDTLAVDLTLKAPGGEFTVPVIFNNRKRSEIRAYNDELMATAQAEGKDIEWVNRQQFLYLVNTYDGCDKLDDAFAFNLDDEYPGLFTILFTRYHELRSVELVKN